jgi:hypothetical protein
MAQAAFQICRAGGKAGAELRAVSQINRSL